MTSCCPSRLWCWFRAIRSLSLKLTLRSAQHFALVRRNRDDDDLWVEWQWFPYRFESLCYRDSCCLHIREGGRDTDWGEIISLRNDSLELGMHVIPLIHSSFPLLQESKRAYHHLVWMSLALESMLKNQKWPESHLGCCFSFFLFLEAVIACHSFVFMLLPLYLSIRVSLSLHDDTWSFILYTHTLSLLSSSGRLNLVLVVFYFLPLSMTHPCSFFLTFLFMNLVASTVESLLHFFILILEIICVFSLLWTCSLQRGCCCCISRFLVSSDDHHHERRFFFLVEPLLASSSLVFLDWSCLPNCNSGSGSSTSCNCVVVLLLFLSWKETFLGLHFSSSWSSSYSWF